MANFDWGMVTTFQNAAFSQLPYHVLNIIQWLMNKKVGHKEMASDSINDQVGNQSGHSLELLVCSQSEQAAGIVSPRIA